MCSLEPKTLPFFLFGRVAFRSLRTFETFSSKPVNSSFMQVQVPARLGTTPALCAQCEGGGADGLGFGFSGFAVLPSCLTRWQNGSSLHPGMERSRCSTGASRERLCQCQVRKVLSIFLSLQVRDVGSLLLRANLACLQRNWKFIQFLFLSCQVPLPPAPHLVHGRGAVPK